MKYLTACAMFRQENPWLDEWIRYHLSIGVEHFLLCNDDEDTRVSDRILQPYVEQGFLENIHVRDLYGTVREDRIWRQKDVYRAMIEKSVGRTRWLAIIDLDELILPRACDDLRVFLQDYEEHAGLAMNWCIYGSDGHIKRPPTQINHLLHRSHQDWEPNQYVKSIVKPEKVVLDKIYDVHHFPTEGGDTVNENHEPVHWMKHAISTEKIRVNHYVLRSWQDFWEVKASRPRFNGFGAFDVEYFRYHDRNEVFDDEISKRFGHVLKGDEAITEKAVSAFPTSEKPRIKVLQYMYGDQEYFSISEKINGLYCRHHGHEHKIVRTPPRTDRHITWQKIPVILSELNDCDYLLFLDADAIFYGQEHKIVDELIPLMNGKPILMAQDIGCESLRWTPGRPNSGVIFMKNEESVKEYFEYWNTGSEIDESTRWSWPPEQRALWDIVMPKYPDRLEVHSEYYLIQGRYGQFIRHYMLMPNEERLEKMKTFCQFRNIQ